MLVSCTYQHNDTTQPVEHKIDIAPSFSQGTPGVYHYPSSKAFKHMGLKSYWRFEGRKTHPCVLCITVQDCSWLKLLIHPKVRPRLWKSTHTLNITPQEDIRLAAECKCVWILNCESSFPLKDFVNACICWLATVAFPLTLVIIPLELLIHPSHFGQSILDVPKVSSWTSRCKSEKRVYIYIYNASRNPPCWWLWRLWLWVVGGILWLWLLLLPQLCIPLVPQALLALPLAALNVASDQPCASSSDTSSKCLKHCSTASRLRSNEECHFCHHAMLAKDLETQIQMKSSEHIQGDPF